MPEEIGRGAVANAIFSNLSTTMTFAVYESFVSGAVVARTFGFVIFELVKKSV